MAKRQTQTTDSLPLVAIDLGSDSVRAMAAQRIAPDLFRILGVEELLAAAEHYGKSPYGEHLRRVAEGRLFSR